MVGGMFGNKLWVRGGRTAGLAGTAVAGRRVLGRTSSSLGVATCLTAVTGLVALADFARDRADDDRRDRLLVMEYPSDSPTAEPKTHVYVQNILKTHKLWFHKYSMNYM